MSTQQIVEEDNLYERFKRYVCGIFGSKNVMSADQLAKYKQQLIEEAQVFDEKPWNSQGVGNYDAKIKKFYFENPDQFLDSFNTPQLRKRMVNDLGYSFYRTNEMIYVLEKNANLLNEIKIEDLKDMVRFYSYAQLYNLLVIEAEKAFEAKDLNKLQIYASEFGAVGESFPVVKNFMINCKKFALENQHEELNQTLYRGLSWNTGWYLTHCNGFLLGLDGHKPEALEPYCKARKRAFDKLQLLTVEDIKIIVDLFKPDKDWVEEYNKTRKPHNSERNFNRDLVTHLRLTPEKVELIKQKIIELPNGKKECKEEMVCLSQTQPAVASNNGELGAISGNNKRLHNKGLCKCFCQCKECWHNMCSEIYMPY